MKVKELIELLTTWLGNLWYNIVICVETFINHPKWILISILILFALTVVCLLVYQIVEDTRKMGGN